MPRLGYWTVSCSSGTTSSWKSCKMNILVYQPRDPGCCSSAGLSGLTLVVLDHESSPADSRTSNQPISILHSSSWRSKVWLLSSTELLSFPWAGAAKDRLEPHTRTSWLDPEEQSSRRMCQCRQKGLQGAVEKSWIKLTCFSKVLQRTFPNKHQTPEWFTIFSLLQT